ncbi:MAG TPA: GAF domain-containing SpoIIE family protein phosphatase [Thermoleophilaceae bacterium]|nr:GAF domain-containing SpoIIE family protein phosphatase [Thermoleophilaceae bacterium]
MLGTRPRGRSAAHDAAWLDATLGRLIDHVRTLLAVDGVAFLVVDRERRYIEPLADWYSSPALREAIEPANRRPYDPSRPGLVEYALERDRPLLLPRVEAWESGQEMLATAVDVLGEARASRIWDAYRTASVIACPVKTAFGRALGVLAVGALPPKRAFSTAELKTVQVLADMSALALERAQLLEAEGRRARGEVRLKRASEAMSSSLELEDVYRSVVRHAAMVTDTTKALLTRLNLRAGELRPVASVDLTDEVAGRRFALDAGVLGEVARTRTPTIRGSGEDETWNGDAHSSMHAPIELGPRLYGVLSVAHEEEGRFGEDDLELLVKLARSSAAAIANAIDFQRERRIARALTLGFVPESLPVVEGYETGVLYAPAANEPTGGDVYGAWGLRGGEVAVLVGDVAGKGVETAALSAMVRFFIEARSWDSPCPRAVLEQANAMLQARLPPDSFATAFLGILSPGQLRYCNAGHLPPLHVADGEARPLESHGLPLGVEESVEYQELTLELGPRDLVFGYTDGLIEARRAGEVFGLDRLARFVSDHAVDLSPQDLVRSVHDEVAAWADGLSDDAVVLALRRRA